MAAWSREEAERQAELPARSACLVCLKHREAFHRPVAVMFSFTL